MTITDNWAINLKLQKFAVVAQYVVSNMKE